jgi:hypothetical protein
MRLSYRILLLAAAWLGVSAGSAPLIGCCGAVACSDGVVVTLTGTSALRSPGAELQVTFGTDTFNAHVDFTNGNAPDCVEESASGWFCGGLPNGLELRFPLTDDADSKRLYLTLTANDGSVITRYQGIVETPVVRPNGALCGPSCREGRVSIMADQPT